MAENPHSSRRFHFNIGVIIFGAIFLYLLATLVLYFTSSKITSYEVQKGRLARNTSYTGVVLRDETVSSTDMGGYISYYQTEAQKVKVGSTVYSIDTNGSTTKTINSYSGDTALTADNLKTLESSISEFQKSSSAESFDQLYDFQYRLESQLLDIHSQSIIQQLDTLSSYDPNTFKTYKADKDGVIVYSIDGLEGLTLQDITSDIMNKTSYKKSDLREQSEVSAGAPVYKTVTSENWSVCIKLDDSTYSYLSDNDVSQVQIRIKKDNALLWADVSLNDIDGMHIAELKLNNSMVRYVSDRYLDIEMIIQDESGLKIPQSAVITKSFYVIPQDYIVNGGDSNSTGVLLKTSDKSQSAVFQEATVYDVSTDSKQAYVSTDVLKSGSVLYCPDSGETFAIGETAPLRGVYCINKGYAVFRFIDVVYENSEYCIVKEDTSYGISNYDFIALKASSVKENKIVY